MKKAITQAEKDFNLAAAKEVAKQVQKAKEYNKKHGLNGS